MSNPDTAKVITDTGAVHSKHETPGMAEAAAATANEKAAEMGLTVRYSAVAI